MRAYGSKQLPLSNIDDILGIVRRERNLYTAQELRILQREQPGSFTDDDVLRVGSRIFRDFDIPDLKKITKAYQNYSIIDASSELVSEAALFAYRFWHRLARRHIDTGRYIQSTGIYVRTIGGTDNEIPLSTLSADNLPSRPVVSIVPDVAYANMLETLLHHGQIQGFLFHTSQVVKRKYKRDLAVKFDYIAAPRLNSSYKGGTLPRLQISQPGGVRGRSRAPRDGPRRSRR